MSSSFGWLSGFLLLIRSCTAGDWYASAVDFSQMARWDGLVCEAKGLAAVGCTLDLWQRFLELLCQHCSGRECINDPQLMNAAQEVLSYFTNMAVSHRSQLESFACRHGLLAALAFHLEHDGLAFRWPQVELELVRPPEELVFSIRAEDAARINSLIELRFREAGVLADAMDLNGLAMEDVRGAEVNMGGGMPALERFPLTVRYRPAPTHQEYLNIRRRVRGYGGVKVTLNIHFPVMNLSPFPVHTARFRALRHVSQAESDQFVERVSSMLSAAGVFHVVLDGDFTAKYFDEETRYLRVAEHIPGLMGDSIGEPGGPSQPPEPLLRQSLFVPVEQRPRVLELLWGPGDGPGNLGSHLRAVELSAGHLQVGERAHLFGTGLNFRMLLPWGLWASLYFYATEAGGAEPDGAALLPMAFWVPCRLPGSEIFPVRYEPLDSPVAGHKPVALPRPNAHQAARATAAPDELDPLVAAMKTAEQPSILRGSCREALQRASQLPGVAGALAPVAVLGMPPRPPLLPELLPMHDFSSQLSFGTNMEMLMSLKQVHPGPGVEHYQDKIALSAEFGRRGHIVPHVHFASYDWDFDVRPTLRRLELEGRAYVAKANHMCCSWGVYVMENGRDHATGKNFTLDEIQDGIKHTFLNPVSKIDARCGDWGTVEAGKRPGVIVEDLMKPSLPLTAVVDVPQEETLEWVTPDMITCHFVWSEILYCLWDIRVRLLSSGEVRPEKLGTIFRDGTCMGCRFAMPFRSKWPSTVAMLESLLPHADYVRVSMFIKDDQPVLNEMEYTTGGLEVVPQPISRDWTLRWLEGYYRLKA